MFPVIKFVKSLLKKLYYRILDPLRLVVLARCESMVAEERFARDKLMEELQNIKIDNQNMKVCLDQQLEYIAVLRRMGLHEMLSHYESSKLRFPEVVLAAAADVVLGMEPSSASAKYKVPAHEIIYWAGFMLEKLNVHERPQFERAAVMSIADERLTLAALDAGQNDIDLLENQIAFNMKTAQHREAAINVEVTRLKEVLSLEQLSGTRAVAGK